MSLFALTLAPETRAVLYSIVKGLFIFFIAVSFVNVAIYMAAQIRAGRLFSRETAPLALVMQPPATGWLFALCVLGLIWIQSFLFPIMVMFGIGVAVLQNQRPLEMQFGFDRLRLSRALTMALLVCGAVILVEKPLMEASGWLLDYFKVAHPDQVSVQTFRQYNEASAIILFLSTAVIFNPLIEEFFFRGFLMTFLKNYTSNVIAIVLSGGVFAVAHLNVGAVIPLWFLGIVLGIAYEHTGSLVVPIGIHACFNLVTGLSLLIEKGNPS
jgi:membrane protease YdiL (CAAX protease family)